jgi:thiol-disulfide isomerase/thioredoxin
MTSKATLPVLRLVLSLLAIKPSYPADFDYAFDCGGEQLCVPKMTHLTAETFNQTLVHADPKKLHVVEFYAPWCPICQGLAPTYGFVASSFGMNQDVVFAGLNCETQSSICVSQQITGFPTFKFWYHDPSDSSQDLVADPWNEMRTAGNFIKAIEKKLQERGKATVHSNTSRAGVMHTRKDVLPVTAIKLQDLASTIHYTLDDAVSTGLPTKATVRSLGAWVDLLSGLLPGLDTDLATLQALLQQQGKDGAATDIEALGRAKEHLTLWEQPHPLVPPGGGDRPYNWSTCVGSQHGYPCGLWELFHTLTLAESDSDTGPSSAAYEPTTLRGIRDFVDAFFRCSDCRQHFLDRAKGGKGQSGIEMVDSKQVSVLWLWRVHNEVSQRLAPSWNVTGAMVLYPTMDVCFECATDWGGIECASEACMMASGWGDDDGGAGDAGGDGHGSAGDKEGGVGPGFSDVTWHDDMVMNVLQRNYFPALQAIAGDDDDGDDAAEVIEVGSKHLPTDSIGVAEAELQVVRQDEKMEPPPAAYTTRTKLLPVQLMVITIAAALGMMLFWPSRATQSRNPTHDGPRQGSGIVRSDGGESSLLATAAAL